jgi:hypothetical protein
MAKRLADELAKTNAEYNKLRRSREKAEGVSETPDHQSPGYRGHDYPDYSRWTTEELRSATGDLGISDVDRMDRDELLSALQAAGTRKKD